MRYILQFVIYTLCAAVILYLSKDYIKNLNKALNNKKKIAVLSVAVGLTVSYGMYSLGLNGAVINSYGKEFELEQNETGITGVNLTGIEVLEVEDNGRKVNVVYDRINNDELVFGIVRGGDVINCRLNLNKNTAILATKSGIVQLSKITERK